MDDGTVTARARALLARIATVDPQLRCYVAVDEAAVLREAARLDAVEPGARGPLHGRALAVKDIIDVAGLPTRAGSSFFRRDPEHDAPAVAALRAAGALVDRKDEHARVRVGHHHGEPALRAHRQPVGPVAHRRRLERRFGAAVAAGLADIALGSDTLGSIRIPAALNGISGVRPATGALPLDGIFPLALGLDTVGPFARDLAGVRQVYDVLAGSAVPDAAVRRACRLRGGAWDGVDTAVTAALDAAAAALRADGVTVDDVTWWDGELVRAVGVVQQRAAARVHAPYFAEHEAEYGEDVRARVAQALTLTGDDETDARAVVARARASWNAATFMYEVALAPSVGAEAPLAPVPKTFRDETIPLVTPASAFGLPVAAVPIGFGPAGLPLGMQIIAAGGAIASAFALGAAFQRLTDWHERRPSLVPA